MPNLAGLTPTVADVGDDVRLRWTIGENIVETDFDRFRPVKLIASQQRETFDVTWGDFLDLPITDQFFAYTVERAAGLTLAAAPFETDFETASKVARQADLPFAGMIFHMARTGSTLIHRLFSRTGKVHSLSEVTQFDEAVRRSATWDPAHRLATMRDLVGTYRRPRRPNERFLTAKMTDVMSSLHLPVYRAAFPEVPWIFVYREPIEVMMSALRRPTGTMEGWFRNRTHAAERLGMPELADPSMWPDEFVARTLGRICSVAVETARAAPPGMFLAVSYKRLPNAIWETIAPHFGIELSAAERTLMEDQAKYNSKDREVTEFRPDSDRKQKAAGKRAVEHAERFVAPLIRELEALPQG